jgi:chemotaxis protein MotB
VSAARRHKKHHHEEHENHERWLVSGYDMMTLLFAVFVVLFAISSTNISKVKLLEQSLQEAFSGPVLTGGRNLMQTGDTSEGTDPAAPEKPLPSLRPAQAVAAAMKSEDSESAMAAVKRAAQEEESFQELKKRIDALAAKAGLRDKVSTTVSLRGLKIRLITDGLFFESGSAVVKPGARPTLAEIGDIVAKEAKHPVQVEGHTDIRPISTSRYPSKWQLSGARAAAVVQGLTEAGVSPKRTSLGGYAAQHPIASNATLAGRARNRRVEIILTRLHGATPSQGGDTTP